MRKKAMAKLGEDMHAALGSVIWTSATTNALSNVTATTLGEAGLGVTVADNAGSVTGATTVPTLTAGDSAGTLGGWKGMNYAHTNTGTKVGNAAVVYTNRGADTEMAFTDLYVIISGQTGDNAANNGYHAINNDSADVRARILASSFEHPGTQTHEKTDGKVSFKGTYDGASGTYRCTGADACTSTNDG